MSILVTAAALASILSVPVPAKPVWFPNAREARRIDPDGAMIEMQMAISPEGEVTQCTSPSATVLNEWACEKAKEKMRFAPATDVTGKPAFGRFEMGVRLKGRESPKGLRSWIITVDDLPWNVRTSAMSTIALLVSDRGVVEQCLMKALEPALPRELAYGLEEKACVELRQNYRPDPVFDNGGAPVPYVQRIVFQFKRSER